jgi:hypothetical protein
MGGQALVTINGICFIGHITLALVGFQGRGFDDVVQSDFCDPTPR